MISRGLPVAYSVPDPVYMSPTAMGMMKNAPNPDGARALLNWWISVPVQSYRAETYGQNVMNRHALLSPGCREPPADPASSLDHMVEIDYYAVLQDRAAWVDRFQREIATASMTQ